MFNHGFHTVMSKHINTKFIMVVHRFITKEMFHAPTGIIPSSVRFIGTFFHDDIVIMLYSRNMISVTEDTGRNVIIMFGFNLKFIIIIIKERLSSYKSFPSRTTAMFHFGARFLPSCWTCYGEIENMSQPCSPCGSVFQL